eukprot:m.214138 g.214138  ORF g.214138 m.214138 type:complete len:321 (+) comp19070_c0_seq4:1604-2566(+)
MCMCAVYVFMCLCEWVHVCVCLCVYVCASAYVVACVFTCLCECVHVYVCYVWLCVCVHLTKIHGREAHQTARAAGQSRVNKHAIGTVERMAEIIRPHPHHGSCAQRLLVSAVDMCLDNHTLPPRAQRPSRFQPNQNTVSTTQSRIHVRPCRVRTTPTDPNTATGQSCVSNIRVLSTHPDSSVTPPDTFLHIRTPTWSSAPWEPSSASLSLSSPPVALTSLAPLSAVVGVRKNVSVVIIFGSFCACSSTPVRNACSRGFRTSATWRMLLRPMYFFGVSFGKASVSFTVANMPSMVDFSASNCRYRLQITSTFLEAYLTLIR